VKKNRNGLPEKNKGASLASEAMGENPKKKLTIQRENGAKANCL